MPSAWRWAAGCGSGPTHCGPSRSLVRIRSQLALLLLGDAAAGATAAAWRPAAAAQRSPRSQAANLMHQPSSPQSRPAPPPAGTSPEGLRAWEGLRALQDGKAPPAPRAANSSFKRSSLEEPLVFRSPAWRLELSNMTGAIIGLARSSSSSGGGGSGTGSSAAPRPSWLQRAAAWLRLPAAWLGDGGGNDVNSGGGGWASFDAPLALPVYSTYSEDDYDVFWSEYSWNAPGSELWRRKDFGKPNATGAPGGGGRGAGGAADEPASLCCLLNALAAAPPAEHTHPDPDTHLLPPPWPALPCPHSLLQSRAARGAPSTCLWRRRCGGGPPRAAACTWRSRLLLTATRCRTRGPPRRCGPRSGGGGARRGLQGLGLGGLAVAAGGALGPGRARCAHAGTCHWLVSPSAHPPPAPPPAGCRRTPPRSCAWM